MKRLTLFLSALLLAACSGNPSLPTRQIDHPYTLPADTKTASFGVETQFVKRDGASRDTVYLMPHGNFLSPIDDNWTWELLTMLRHQFHHDDVNTYGIRFGLYSLGYATVTGWFFNPGVSLYQKHKFGANFALETTLGGSFFIRTHRDYANGWRAFLELAPLFQLDESKAVSLRVIPTKERRFSYDSSDRQNLIATQDEEFTLPLGADFQWRWSQIWETRLGYMYRRFGYEGGYRSHNLLLAFTNYW